MLPKKRHPVHPGVVLSEDFLKPLGISASEFAKTLGGKWSEKEINDIIAGKENVTDKAAKSFAQALDTSSDFWLFLQNNYSQWYELHHKKERAS